MVRTRLFAAAAIAAVLAVPASAGAAQRVSKARTPASRVTKARTPIAVSPLSLAATVAQRYWKATPCGGRITFVTQQPLAPGIDPETDAWVTFDSPLGANDLAAPAAGYTNCTIAFARWRWPTSATMRADWEMFCLTMTHEMGHLVGRAHDSAPGSVMASLFVDDSRVPAICRTTRPAGSTR